jgi:Putative beta-barrel porin 2
MDIDQKPNGKDALMRKTHSLKTRLSVIAGVIGLFALQAQAQTSPWYVGVNQRFEHHTNLFQAAAAEVSDTVSRSSVVAGLDQPIGRQRLFGRLTAGTNRYSTRSDLNHNAYSVVAGLDWETADRLSGNVTFDASETLADFNPVGLPGVLTNNTTNTQGLRGSVRIGVVTRLTAEVGGATRKTRYDNSAYQIRNVDIDEIYGRVRYRPAGSLVLGVGVRATRGDYPNFRNPSAGVFVSEGFKRDNLDLTAEWPISGASRVDARLSFGKDRYDTLAARDFSGATGEVSWNWQPTGRTSLTTVFTRRTGDDTSISTVPGQVPYATAANQVSNTLGASVDYDLTGKIKLRGSLALSDSKAVDLIRGTTSNEFITAASAGLTWDATRAIRAGCDISMRSRADKAGIPGYDATVFGCYGEFVLR